jgi:hypothetical protein
MVVKAGGISATGLADITFEDADTPTVTVTDTTNTVTGVLRADDDTVDVGSTTAHAVNLIVSGSSVGTFNSTGLSVGTNGAGLLNTTKAATTPNILVDAAETDTGFGGTGADNISVVLGGTRYFSWNTVATNVNAGNFVIVAGTYVQNGGNFTFNEAGGNYDFRVESEDNDNIFVIDGGDNSVSVGGTVGASALFAVRGTFTPGATTARGFLLDPTLTVASGQDAQGTALYPTLAAHSSGTHANLHGVQIGTVNITDNGATITNAASLIIDGAPTEATNNYALWVDAGDVRFDEKLGIGLPSGTAAFSEIHIHEESASGSPMIKWSNSATGAGNAEGLELILSGDESVKFRLYENTAIHFDVNNVEQLKLSTSETIFNDPGNNVDFRVEGTTSDHLLFADSSNDSVSIGVNGITPSVVANQPFAIYADDASQQNIRWDNGSTGQWQLQVDNNDKVTDQKIFRIGTDALDSADNPTNYNQLDFAIGNATSGSESGKFVFNSWVQGAGERVVAMFNGDTGWVFNDSQDNLDFRVESDATASAFQIDGGLDTASFGSAPQKYSYLQIWGTARNLIEGDNWYIAYVGSIGTYTTSASSGTHTLIAGLRVDPPNITIDTAVVTTAASLYIQAGPTVAANNYALWVDAGASRFDGILTATGNKLHIQHGSTGGSVSGNNDDLVVENTGGEIGITLLSDNNTNASLTFADPDGAQAGRITYTHGAPAMLMIVENVVEVSIEDSQYIFNGGENNRDFRIGGNSAGDLVDPTYAFHHDAGLGTFGIGKAASANRPLQWYIDSNDAQVFTFDNAGNTYAIWEWNTDRKGDGQLLHRTQWQGNDSGDAEHAYARMDIFTVLDNAGAETGRIEFYASVAASNTEILAITGDVLGPGVHLENGAGLYMEETSERLAKTNYGCLWTESDNTLHFKDGAGTEYTVDITAV